MLYVKQLETCEAITIDTEKLKSTLLDIIYPVGSIYMSVRNISPESFIGGVWSIYGSGRVLVGVDAYQSEFSSAEKAGGSKSINLAHSHSVDSHSHILDNHGWAKIGRCGNYIEGIAYKIGSGAGSTTYDRTQTNGGGITGGSFAAIDTTQLGGYTGSAGSYTDGRLSSTQSILPPYTTCYMWKRIA